MPSLFLFGDLVRLNLDEPYEGTLGNNDNKLKAMLKAGTSPGTFLLDIDFDGQNMPQGKVRFTSQFDCTIDKDGVISLQSVHTGASTTASVLNFKIPFGLGEWSAPNSMILVGAQLKMPEVGVGFADNVTGNPLRSILTNNYDVSAAFPTVLWGGTWPTFRFATFNFAKIAGWPDTEPYALFKSTPTGTTRELLVIDNFADSEVTVPPIEREQVLNITVIHASASEIRVFCYPRNHALLIHPDILDTETKPKEGNDILYQFALANGYLKLSFKGKDIKSGSAYWQKSHDAERGKAALVVYRLSDEHGNPIVIEGPYFPLSFRSGVIQNITQNDTPSDREKALQGLLIQTGGARTASLKSEQGLLEDKTVFSLSAIDPVQLDPTNKDRETYWLVKDDANPQRKVVKTNKNADERRIPTEIHGLARGSFLELIPTKSAFPKEGIPCGIRTDGIDQGGALIFTKSELLLDLKNWQIKGQLVEREINPGIAELPQSPVVGMRVASPKNVADNLRLPLIDTSYSLANQVGQLRDKATLATEGYKWVRELDDQFVSKLFDTPTLENQTHVQGFEIHPPPKTSQVFQSFLDLPPGKAESPAKTARTDANMVSAFNQYVHGGTRKGGAVDTITGVLTTTDAQKYIEATNKFVAFWNSGWEGNAASAEVKAWRALRAFLAPKADELSDEFFGLALKRAKEIVLGEEDIEGIGKRFAELKTTITQGLTLEQFKTIWYNPPSIPNKALLIALFDYLWSPGNASVFRQALAVVRLVSQLPDQIKEHEAVLKQMIGDFGLKTPEKIKEYLEAAVPGFLSGVQMGVDLLYRKLIEVWETGTDLDWKALRQKYGIGFTPDVYFRLTDNANIADARKVVELFNKAYASVPLVLKQLQGLRSEPPDYIFYTQRFKVEQKQDSPDMGWLWRKAFDLCRMGADKAWNFFLDKDSSVILKLTGKKRLPDILQELHDTYSSPERPNPLGLPIDVTADKAIKKFAEGRLHTDLKDPNWRGILILNPIADLFKDEQLRDLAGFQYIGATYVALGGAKPLLNVDKQPELDVYANIYQQAPEPKLPKEGGDISFTLIKFDVTIKHTEIESGEIVFLLQVRNLWGRKEEEEVRSEKRTGRSEGQAPKDVRSTFDKIYVRGTLPPQTKSEGEKESPRSFEFAAWFEKPYVAPINIAFIKEFKFKAIRVGTNKGQSSINIDGDLVFQEWEFIDFFDGMDEPFLGLENFRILLPRLEGNPPIRLGLPRALNFDFPSVTFNFPKPRVIHLAGIEIKPTQIGFVRVLPGLSGSLNALKDLKDRFSWLGGFEWPSGDLNFDFPFVRFQLDFGKLPSLGRSNLSELKFDLALGLQMPEKHVRLGIGGIQAKEIVIDLFRVLTLHIEKFRLGEFKGYLTDQSGNPKPPIQSLQAVKASNVQLKILDWSLLPEGSKFQFLLAQENTTTVDDAGTKKRADPNKKNIGALGYFAEKPPKDPFIQLHWLLLAHNLKLDPKILNYLLFFEGGAGNDIPDLMDKLVDESKNPPHINAIITEDEQWLFGISFALKNLMDRCRLIFHDQHYYGISLRAKFKWFESIFGKEGITLAYIPGPTRDHDKFRTSFRIPGLDMFGPMRSGEFALEWAVNWDYLIDFGFPWKGGAGYDWFRAFSLPAGTYEAKFGFYFEKRTQLAEGGGTELTIGAGVGFYIGYYFGFSSPIVWLRAGIGVFAILEGIVVFKMPGGGELTNLLKGSIKQITVRGVIGIFAYGEGGIDVWVLSARFRVQVQAALAGQLDYVVGGASALSYAATLSASYYASVEVGCGFFSFTFTVSGSIEIGVSGRILLN